MDSAFDARQALLLERLSDVFEKIPFNRILDLKLEHLDREMVIMRFNMKEALVGNFIHRILHGGVTSSVLDMAGGMAAMASIIFNGSEKTDQDILQMIARTSTVNLQISYIRPGRGEVFTAKGWLTHTGNKIAFAQMELRNETNELIATGSASYLFK